jgi:putative transposase
MRRTFDRFRWLVVSIASILKEHGLEPAPERNRKTTRKEFPSRHWEAMVAADLFTVEVWAQPGPARFPALFAIDLSARRVEHAGIGTKADGIWMGQRARSLRDGGAGFLTGKRYLIHDRDAPFTAGFPGTPAASGVKSVKLPPRSPNLSPHAERFVGTIEESCLDRRFLFGDPALRPGDGH